MNNEKENTVITFRDIKELLDSRKCISTAAINQHDVKIHELAKQIETLNKDTDKILESQQRTEESLLNKLSSIEKSLEGIKVRANSFHANIKKRVSDIEENNKDITDVVQDLKTKLVILETNVGGMKSVLELNQGKLFTTLQDIEKVLTPEMKTFLVDIKKHFETNKAFWHKSGIYLTIIVAILTIVVYGKEILKMLSLEDKTPKVEISESKEKKK